MPEQTDLLIINPPAAHGIYGALGDELTAIEPPLWCRLIAGYCRDRGHNVRIIDAEAEAMTPAAVAAAVAILAPRLTCIAAYGHQPSASTQQMHAANLTVQEIKRLANYNQVIMVGGHVSALPERTLRECAADYACIGEGPVTVERLLAGDAEETIPGLVWRSWNWAVIHKNRPAALIEDMRQLNGNTWDLLPMQSYRAHNWQCFDNLAARKPYASIYTSLGCPYRCSFCCINAPFGTNRYRMRSPADVAREVVMLRDRYGVRTIKIVDEMFVLNERHYTEIAGLLAALFDPDELNIWAYARVDTVKAGHLPLLRRAGLRWLALGIESGSAHVRDGASKQLRNDDIVGVVRQVQDAGINVIGNYIFGLPDDDMDTMRSTLELALECNTEFANFYSAMAYPGSRLYQEAIENGWTLPSSWRGFSQHNDDCRPLDTRHVSAAEVLRFRDAAFNAYFRSPGYRRLVLSKFGQETLAHVERMTTYTLKRKLLEKEAA